MINRNFMKYVVFAKRGSVHYGQTFPLLSCCLLRCNSANLSCAALVYAQRKVILLATLVGTSSPCRDLTSVLVQQNVISGILAKVWIKIRLWLRVKHKLVKIKVKVSIRLSNDWNLIQCASSIRMCKCIHLCFLAQWQMACFTQWCQRESSSNPDWCHYCKSNK